MMMVDTITHIRMLWLGFDFHCTRATSIDIFPPRPAVLVTSPKQSPAKQLSYWLRPHTSKTRLPVLFIHGIGVGLIPNIDLLRDLDLALNCDNKHDGQVSVMAVEILQISSRLTHVIPKRSDYLDQLTQVLDTHHFERFVLASRSYGSVLSTCLLTHEPLASRVTSTLLIDPITILLHMPDVAYNFTARPPKHVKEWQLSFFGAKDPGVAYTLGRQFFWSENILWYDRISELIKHGTNITASLGGQDVIVNTRAIRNYLTKHTVPRRMTETEKEGLEGWDGQADNHPGLGGWRARDWEGKGLEILWFDDLGHAQVFNTPGARKKLVRILVEYSKVQI
jgi:pimeloyl-ACP methyl ester carboxylesterase